MGDKVWHVMRYLVMLIQLIGLLKSQLCRMHLANVFIKVTVIMETS